MVNEEASVTWVRNFDTETESPIEGQTTGQIPEWLEGALIRNGSGIYQIGITSMKHLFDGMAVIHRFGISKGKATYQNRILKSDTYLESKAANRLTVMQFGTNSTPDPCKSLFGKFMSHFEIPTPEGLTDNCGVNVVSYGDALYAVTESHKIRKIDPKTLETLGEKTNLRKYVAVNMVTAHPHIDEDGTVYNMGNSIGANGSAYNIIEFPPGDASFTEAKIVATIPARWKFNPSYYHSFAITDNYFVFAECPVSLPILKLLATNLTGKTVGENFTFFHDKLSKFIVIERKTGKMIDTVYEAPAFFTFHHGNAYEKDGHLIIDLSHYEDIKIISDLMLDSLTKKEVELAVGIYTRFVLPLNVKVPGKGEQRGVNLVQLEGVKAKSYWLKENAVFCEPEHISTQPIELPRINYIHNGRYYRYVYGVSQPAGTKENIYMMKLDVDTGKFKLWEKEGFSVSEPVYVARPQATREDDGLILFSALHQTDLKRVLLVILDASTFEEVSCTEFIAKGTVTKDFHGVFASDSDNFYRF